LQQYIQKYLLQHHHVSIEGWGTMRIENQPAHIDFPNRILYPGVLNISFNDKAENEVVFQNWLASELKISSLEASNKIKSYVSGFKSSLENGSIDWDGWGSFSKQFSKAAFTPSIATIPAPVHAERVIRKGAEHHIRVGEQQLTNTEMEEMLHVADAGKKHLWWVAGLVMSILGIILAILFANQHNIQWKNFTNHHLLHPQEPPVLYKIP
jgi:nucleoid DNA-binding protein